MLIRILLSVIVGGITGYGVILLYYRRKTGKWWWF